MNHPETTPSSESSRAPSHAAPTPGSLVPNDHLKLLIELLQPLGPELVRRWVAALMLVHRDDRESVVSAVERRLAQLYPLDAHDERPSAAASDIDVNPQDVRPTPRKAAGRMSA